MEKPTKVQVRRILGALKRSKKKVISLDALSRLVGLYSDVLGQQLAYFEPMLLLDPGINMRDLIPAMERYLEEPSDATKANKPKTKRVVVTKKDLAGYTSVTDFVYKKMTTIGGLVDTSIVLSDEDLKLLSRLIEREQAKRKAPKSKKRK